MCGGCVQVADVGSGIRAVIVVCDGSHIGARLGSREAGGQAVPSSFGGGVRVAREEGGGRSGGRGGGVVRSGNRTGGRGPIGEVLTTA